MLCVNLAINVYSQDLILTQFKKNTSNEIKVFLYAEYQILKLRLHVVTIGVYIMMKKH